MSRPQKERRVKEPPKIQGMKPIGVPGKLLDKVILSIDEYEALRLADYEGMAHQNAADRMEVSRPTFTRLIEKARKKMAESIIEVKDLIIEGGTYSFKQILVRCINCGIVSMFKPESKINNCPECESDNIIHLNNWFHKQGCLNGRGRNGKGKGHGNW